MPTGNSPVRPQLHAVNTMDASVTGMPLRIAIVAPPWIPVPPPNYGGTEAVLDVLCRGLSDRGHEVLLVCTGESECPVDRRSIHSTALGTEHARVNSEVAHAVFAYDAARSWSADVIHDHTLAGPWVGAALSEVPVVVTNHGPFAGELSSVFRCLSSCLPIIAISTAQARAAGPGGVATIIHHGLDVSQVEFSAGPGDHALFVGRMSPDKGVHVAIDIARRAGVPLVIAAKMREASEREYFESMVRPLLGPGVEYVGEVTRHEHAALHAGATCLINPLQWNEPFGLVAIEALAAGVPVVATPRGAMPEIVINGRTGFLETDVEQLAQAVTAVSSLDRAECRRDVEARFSMARMARDHERFYRGVLAAHRTNSLLLS